MRLLHILVAEDDAMIATLLADVLRQMGHVCTLVRTEADAVTGASRDHPDLMIVDAQLGAGSGVAAIDRILSQGPMPHFFVSGDAPRVRSLRPAAVVLQKPFRLADLDGAIDRALDAARAI